MAGAITMAWACSGSEMEHLLMGFEEIGGDVRAGENFKRQRRDEAAGACGQDHVHRRGFTPKQA